MKLLSRRSNWTPQLLILLGSLALGYVGLQIWSLSWYPFIHSDEVWLASLSRSMVSSGNLGVTEDFFVLSPRYPHGIKTLFHLLQGIFLIGSWSLDTVRFLSLISGLGSLGVFFLLMKVLLSRPRDSSTTTIHRTGQIHLLGSMDSNHSYQGFIAVLATLAWALDPWFFLTAGVGRQESLVLLFMLASVFAVVTRRSLLAGILTGSSIFVHPNSFLIAWAVLPWFFFFSHALSPRSPDDNYNNPGSTNPSSIISKPNQSRSNIVPWISIRTYVLTVSIFAAAAIGLSLWLDPQFFTHYLAFGLEVGVGAPPVGRIQGFFDYVNRMINRTAGTYWIPPFGPSLGLIGLSWAVHLVVHDWKPGSVASQGFRSLVLVSLTLVTVSFAMILIGKFSPTATVFLLPWGYGTLVILGKTKPRFVLGLLIGVIGFNGFALYQDLGPWYPKTSSFAANQYERFIAEIQELVGSEARVLGNLNTGFAFEPDRLRVIRDLGSLPAVDPGVRALPVLQRPLGTFILDQDIGWVLFNYQELELIYHQRPQWNLVYGNPYRFYPDLLDLVQDHGTLVGVISSPWYAQRLVPYMERQDSRLLVYRLDVPR